MGVQICCAQQPRNVGPLYPLPSFLPRLNPATTGHAPCRLVGRDVTWMREEGGRIQGCGGRAVERWRRQERPAQPQTLPSYYTLHVSPRLVPASQSELLSKETLDEPIHPSTYTHSSNHGQFFKVFRLVPTQSWNRYFAWHTFGTI